VPEREYDVIVLGATGFTGALTAEYLARTAGPETRGALAGRNQSKLEEVRGRLAKVNAACAKLPLLQADVSDTDSLRTLAESTKVLITTVGPYINYGEPVVAACAAAGTDYVDLTGEPEFVDLMWLRYHEQAQQTGARLVHSCGFDSIPYDLGALFAVSELPEGKPISLSGFVKTGASFSGGTFHSAITIMGRLRQGAMVARERRSRETGPAGRRVRGVVGRPHHDADAGGWVVPFPTIDPQTVIRSARALERYGPDFSYSHYLVSKRLSRLAGLSVGAGAVIALAQLPPTRKALLKIKDPGDGPSEEQRAKSWFRVRMVGRSDGTRVVAEISGGDPGYGETSKMLAESALCLAHDDLPRTAGQVTPAVAMGHALIERLQRAGMNFSVVERG
jgi:short subunit dehydrogenase-like uncharacterized protein